jgi:hypothetical protein
MFTQVQVPGMPTTLFDRSVDTAEHELTALKALMELGMHLNGFRPGRMTYAAPASAPSRGRQHVRLSSA